MGCHNIDPLGRYRNYLKYSPGSLFLSKLLKIKYWRSYILALFALSANIPKIKKLPKISILYYCKAQHEIFTMRQLCKLSTTI